MREMKDSGIEWIGKIPDNWQVGKVKNFYKMQSGFTPDTKNNNYYDENGYDWVNISDMKDGKIITSTTKKISQLYVDTYHPAVISKGSLLYSFKLSVGQTAYAGKPIYSNEAIVSFLSDEKINLHYLRYSSIFIIENAQTNIYNAKIMNQELIKNAYITFPPLEEQNIIADFLDKKCLEIDTILEKTRASIEAYKKLKQAVITEAVTKGIHGNRPMKDSGIDWIGEIPNDWEKSKLKNIIISVESGVSVNAADFPISADNQIGVLKTSSVSSFCFLPNQNKQVNKEDYKRVSCPVRKNKIIVSRMNTPELVGACGYVDKDYSNLFLPDRLWQVDISDSFCTKYIWYYLINQKVRAYISSLSTGTSSSMQNITKPQFYNIDIVFPQKKEQEILVDYLDEKCSEIDKIIEQKEQYITEIENYKKSLIYECVTGKKEVL